MNRTLLMMRHAKSSWSDGCLADHDRPLNNRGLRDAPRMGRFLDSISLVPDAIISSTANRALTTAKLLSENCGGFNGELVEYEAFYHAPPSIYLERATLLDDSTSIVMFVGHNPGMAEVASMVSENWETMPTAAIARVEFPVDSWVDVQSFSQATLVELWKPKEIDFE
ncbi:MAG: histidine phosphatase family protein [Planctomycetota bacterium]